MPYTIILKNKEEWLARKAAMDRLRTAGYLVTRFLKISTALISD